jgi:hypothetical protein
MSIEFFTRYRMAQRKDSGDLNDAEYWLKQYDGEINKLKAFESPSLDEVFDAYYRACSGTYQK